MRLVLCLVALLAGAPARAQVTPAFPNVPYANLGGTDLRLDVYVPTTGSAPFPCVVWIHGGGWANGSRFPIPAGAAGLLARGIAVASVDYRLTTQAGQFGAFPVTFPAQIEDVKGAVRFLRANAATYGLDPARFGSWGSSAGGHLSALLATSGGVAELEGSTGGNLGSSSAVQAAADYFGPIDFWNMNPDVTTPPGSSIDHDAALSPESRLIGFDQPGQGIGVLRANQSNPNPPFPFFVNLVNQANPITWVDASDPPMHVAHGSGDVAVPRMQGKRLATALRAAGVPYAHNLAIGAGHGLGGPNDTAVHLFFVQEFFGTQAIETTCSADGSLASCPCGNAGDAGHGCANSQAASNGALLVAGGSQNPSTMTIQALGMLPNALCIFVQGDAALGAPVAFGDGLRCAGGHLLRLASRNASQGSALFPDPAAGNLSIQARSSQLGQPIPPGGTRHYLTYFRDSSPAFCPPPSGSNFNSTNGLKIVWP